MQVIKHHTYPSCSHIDYVAIYGGTIREEGPDPKGQWAAIKLESHVFHRGGVVLDKFSNIKIIDAGIGIQLKTVNSTKTPTAPSPPPDDPTTPINETAKWFDDNLRKGGWVNANSFSLLQMFSSRIFIDFLMDGFYWKTGDDVCRDASKLTGIHGNHFEDIDCYCDKDTQCGIQNIKHWNNFFFNVNVKDISKMPAGSLIAKIDEFHTSAEAATQTLIITGEMTSTNQSLFPTPSQCTRTMLFDNNYGPQIAYQILKDIKEGNA